MIFFRLAKWKWHFRQCTRYLMDTLIKENQKKSIWIHLWMDMNTILVMRSMLIYQAKEILSATKDGKKEVREKRAGRRGRGRRGGEKPTSRTKTNGGSNWSSSVRREGRFARSSRECRDLLGECSLNNESQTWAAGMVSHSQITATATYPKNHSLRCRNWIKTWDTSWAK